MAQSILSGRRKLLRRKSSHVVAAPIQGAAPLDFSSKNKLSSPTQARRISMKDIHDVSCSRDTRKYWKVRLFSQRPSTTGRARTSQCLTPFSSSSSSSWSSMRDDIIFLRARGTTIRQRIVYSVHERRFRR